MHEKLRKSAVIAEAKQRKIPVEVPEEFADTLVYDFPALLRFLAEIIEPFYANRATMSSLLQQYIQVLGLPYPISLTDSPPRVESHNYWIGGMIIYLSSSEEDPTINDVTITLE